jgi:CRP-like cAMP-binding protein
MRDRRLIEGVVSNVGLFRGASPSQHAALAKHCWTLEARRYDTIARRDSQLPGAFAVAYGTVKLAFRNGGDKERVLRLVSAGQTFGESTAILGRPCRYEARALAECKLVVIPPIAIFSLSDRDPRIARQIMHTLAERTFDLLEEVESVCMRGGAQRLASYLNSLVGPESPPGARTVRLPATKTLIASRLDMKKETLSRLLRSLVNQGVIAVAQHDITIFDRERLAEVVG